MQCLWGFWRSELWSSHLYGTCLAASCHRSSWEFYVYRFPNLRLVGPVHIYTHIGSNYCKVVFQCLPVPFPPIVQHWLVIALKSTNLTLKRLFFPMKILHFYVYWPFGFSFFLFPFSSICADHWTLPKPSTTELLPQVPTLDCMETLTPLSHFHSPYHSSFLVFCETGSHYVSLGVQELCL